MAVRGLRPSNSNPHGRVPTPPTGPQRCGRILVNRSDLWAARSLKKLGGPPPPAECLNLNRSVSMLRFEKAGLDTELAEALYRLDFEPESYPLYPDVRFRTPRLGGLIHEYEPVAA